MSDEKFPSQDPLEAARTIASDEYQTQQTEAAEREAQTKRLGEWLDGSQANAKDLEKYLENRPYEDAEGIHDPHTDEVIEPVDATTAGKRKRGHWGNKYFGGRRREHYDGINDSPEDWSLGEFVNNYLDAEAGRNRTFLEDHEEAFAKRLNGKETRIAELANAQALAELETEISGVDASRTKGLVADAINKKVTEYHNKNLGKNRSYEIHDEDGKLRTVSEYEAATERDNKFRAQIERLKDRYLAELREEHADQIEEQSKKNRTSSGNSDPGGDPEPTDPTEPTPKDPTEPAPEPGPADPTEPTPEPDPVEPPTEPLDPTSQQEAVVTSEQRIEWFNERLHDWSKLLGDSRFVPTPDGYDEMVAVADAIEFRHLDPEIDGHSGMGYFIKGSGTRLNATQARTLLDKVRATEWVPSVNEEAVMDTVLKEEDPTQVLDVTAEADERRDLITIMDYSHFVELDSDPKDLENLDKYKDYIHGRMVLTHHIHEQHSELLDDVDYYPSAYISEALKDFNKETDSKKMSKIALRGIRRARNRVFKARDRAINKAIDAAARVKEKAQTKIDERRNKGEETSSEEPTSEMPQDEAPDEEPSEEPEA